MFVRRVLSSPVDVTTGKSEKRTDINKELIKKPIRIITGGSVVPGVPMALEGFAGIIRHPPT